MNTQRTLLPYRLKRELAADDIREQLNWLPDISRVECLIDRLMRWERPRWAELRLLLMLQKVMDEDLAADLVRELVDACREVWVVEREWKFPEAFVPLVPAGGVR